MDNNYQPQRLLSLDALRGFDMLFIMGLSGLIMNIAALMPDCAVATWFAQQMRHVAWDGFAHHDTIFPLFLFIAGVSFKIFIFCLLLFCNQIIDLIIIIYGVLLCQ